jgi:4-hydroxythreonine-4-phosphate dehydrogenase
MSYEKPVVALAIGDPAGISPELTAKVIALPEVREAARLVVIGDRRVYAEGEKIAGVTNSMDIISANDPLRPSETPTFVDLGHLDPVTVTRAVAAESGGKFALANYKHALILAREGKADAVRFTPFNKRAMRLARSDYDDEIAFSAEVAGLAGPASEFNVLDRLWNARVTSHIPMAAVSAALTYERIERSLKLTDACLRAAGFERPRIAVAGYNPHASDSGNFGREEIDVIEPAVMAAKKIGIAAEGPFPADTVFLRAKSGAFDAVLTMYHDQGQIAMKLMGFDRGVTLLGGFKFPICTPAHGTAYEIAGQGVAAVGATKAAIVLAAAMANKYLVGERSLVGPSASGP